LEVLYASNKLEKQCTSLREAQRLFGGDAMLAKSLLSRVNAFHQAECLNDIIHTPSFRFHNLHDKGKKKRKGTYAIDVKTIREQWRIIIVPLNQLQERFGEESIDEIATIVKVIKIEEVSKHYE